MKKWLEAMRLRTLPVSISGVLAAIGCALWCGYFRAVPAILCLLFAILAQITSNFANEYYDYKNGLDKKGREGFRRGVTEGDITPGAMKIATYSTLAIAAVVGCLMLFYGPWWLVVAGIAIGLFALAYSTGPYPLSHHGLGDIAVVIFFGIVPVILTCYLQEGGWNSLSYSLPLSISIGLLAANVLIVNNYRDMEDDAAVNKRTTVVVFGREVMGWCYLLSGITAMLILIPILLQMPIWCVSAPLFYLFGHYRTWRKLVSLKGAALNPILGRSAINLLLFTLLLVLYFFIVGKF